jgi:hypothetical protein
MERSFETLPRRIFLDSCTAQTLRDYSGYIYEGESVVEGDRIHKIGDGLANLYALRAIFMVNDRAQFQWIVSRGSLEETSDKRDPGHMQWLWDIADHTQACLVGDGPTHASITLSKRIEDPCFGYLSHKDRQLLREAITLRCEAFLTVERRLPRNAAPLERELGIRVLTPIEHWDMLRPWAAPWL